MAQLWPNLYRQKQGGTCLGFSETLNLCRMFRRGRWKSTSSTFLSFTVTQPEVASPTPSWINTWIRRCFSMGKAKKVTLHVCYVPAAVQRIQGDMGGPLHVSKAVRAKPCCYRQQLRSTPSPGSWLRFWQQTPCRCRTGCLTEDNSLRRLLLLLLWAGATRAHTILEAACWFPACGKASNRIWR